MVNQVVFTPALDLQFYKRQIQRCETSCIWDQDASSGPTLLNFQRRKLKKLREKCQKIDLFLFLFIEKK